MRTRLLQLSPAELDHKRAMGNAAASHGSYLRAALFLLLRAPVVSLSLSYPPPMKYARLLNVFFWLGKHADTDEFALASARKRRSRPSEAVFMFGA